MGEFETFETEALRYEVLVENSPYCIHELDTDGALLSMNPAGLRMMAVEQESEIIGMPYLDAVCADDQPRVRALLEAARHGHFSEFEFTASNGRIFRSNFVPLAIVDGRPTRLMGITQDITERRHLEERLRHSERLDAIGRLAGGVAHDFNNLLTVILGSAEHLEDQVAPGARNDVATILDAATRASDLTAQLLTFARRQFVRPEHIDLSAHVSGISQLLRRVVGDAIDLQLRLPPEPVVVRIDPVQLDQVLVNLATNARQAMPEGGRVDVRLSGTDGAAHLVVEDFGPGMPKQVAERIFEPFYTNKPDGSGLGLATVHGVIAKAGGTIAVDSEEGRGTRFTIVLPILEAAAVQRSHRILVVEDEALVREQACRMLERSGYTVVEADSAEAALAILGKDPDGFDLLFTDLSLPGINGRELAARTLTLAPDLPVLFTSGYTAAFEDGDLGSVAFLPKPYTGSRLLQQLSQLLA